MIATAEATTTELTEYEAEQVERIAAWKAEHPNALAELFRMAAHPVARAFERVIPDAVARKAIEAGYRAAELTADGRDVARRAGVGDVGELRGRPLEECDGLALTV